MTLQRAHRLVGWIGVVVFLATGVYMNRRFPAAFEGDATMRMLFRSAHIYLLLATLMNLLLGPYMRPTRRQRLQRVGLMLLLAAPVLFLLAFALEPAPGKLDRPFAASSAFATLIGCLCHARAARRLASTGRAGRHRFAERRRYECGRDHISAGRQ